MPSRFPFQRTCASVFGALLLCLPMAQAQLTGFLPTLGGTYDFGTVNNWGSSTINWVFGQVLDSPQVITFGSDQLTPTSGLTFNLGGTTPVLQLRSDGNGDRTLTLDGGITVSGFNNATITIGSHATNEGLNVAMSGARTISVDDGNWLEIANTFSGVGHALTKTGAGTLVFTGDATHTGGTSVLGGRLLIGDGGSTGTIVGDVFVDGGTEVGFERSTAYTYAGAVSGGGTLSIGGIGPITLTGANTLTGKTEIEEGATLVASTAGTLSKDSGVYVYGYGTLQVDASQTIQSLSSGVSGGKAEVSLAPSTQLTIADMSGGWSTFEGRIFGDGSLAIAGGSGSRQILEGANEYTGGTTISSGELYLNNATGSATGTGDVTIAQGGHLSIGYGLSGAGALSGNIANDGTVAFARPDASTYAGVISGSGDIEVQQGGTITLTGQNTYSGSTYLGSGKLVVGAVDALPTTTEVSTNNGTTLDVKFDQTIGGFQGWGDICIGLGSSLTIDTEGSSYAPGQVRGGGTLVKAGAGSLTLAGTNSHGGGTVLASGMLGLGSSDALGTGPLTIQSGTLLFNSTSEFLHLANDIEQHWDGDFAISANNGIDFGAGDVTLGGNTEVNVDFGTAIVGGTIDDGGEGYGLVKTGAGTLQLSGTNTYTGPTTIKGGKLAVADLGNDGMPGNLGASSSAASNLVLDGGRLFYNGSGGTTDRLLTLGENGGTIDAAGEGTISFTSTGPIAFTTPDVSVSLTLDAGTDVGPNHFYPVITDNGTAQTSLFKNGTGTWVLGSANTFTGWTNIYAGTLYLADPLALKFSTVNVSKGFSEGAPTGHLAFHAITAATLGGLSGSSDIRLENDSSEPEGVALTVGGNDDYAEYSGALTGAGSLIKTGYGGLTLTGENDFSGGTRIENGTLYIGQYRGTSGSLAGDVVLADKNNATLAFARSDETTFSGSISGEGRLAVQGSGTLILDHVSPFSGIVDIQSFSTLKLGVCNTLSGSVTVQFGGFGTLDLLHDQTLAGLSGDSTNTILFSKTLTLDIPEMSERVEGGGGGEAGFSSLNITTDGNFFNAQFDGLLSGAGKLVKTGAGGLNLTSANDYSGGTEITGGTLIAMNPIDQPGDSATGSGTVTVSGGTLQIGNGGTAGSVAGDIVDNSLVVFNHSSDFTYAGIISGTGGVEVANYSGGALTLTGANSYGGGTTLSGGTLVVAHDTNLGASTGGLVFNGGTLRADPAGGGFTTSRLVTLGAFSNTIDTAGVDLRFNGSFIETSTGNSLTKVGAGTLTLGGDNAYTGFTFVDAGTLLLLGLNATGNVSVSSGASLKIGAGGTTGGLNGNIFNNGSVVIDRSDDVTYSASYGGSGSVTKQGAGRLVLTGSNSSMSAFTIAAGYVAIGDGGTTGSLFGDVLFTGTTAPGGGELQFNRSDFISYSGVVMGPGRVSNLGTGTTKLTGTGSTYSGDTLVTAGTLGDGPVNSFSPNSTVRVNTGATLSVNASQTIAGLDDYATGVSGTLSLGSTANLTIANAAANTFTGELTGTGFLNKSGAGTLTFAGTNSFLGTVSINAGTLRVGATNAFAANNLNVSPGATFEVAKSTAVNTLTGTGTITVAGGETLKLKSSAPLNSVIGGAGSVLFDNGGQSNGVSTISVDQLYGGLTTVNNGTVNLGNGGTAGMVAGDIFLNGSTTAINVNRSNDVSYGGVIGGSGQLRKNGTGTLTLTGANWYSGTTVVNNGTLRVGAANTLPTTTLLSLNGTNAAKLDVAASQTIGAFAVNFSNNGVLTSFGSTIKISLGEIFDVALANRTFDTMFAGTITGDGGLEIGASASGHTVTLLATSNYSGGTTIDSGGTLVLSSAFDNQQAVYSSGMIAGDVVNNGTLVFRRDDDATTFGGRISGNGRVALGTSASNEGSGSVRLTAANTYQGGTDVYHGDLFAMNTSGSATGTGTVTVHDGLLAGTGTITGHVDLLRGARIAPAADLGQPGTLTIGSADFGAGAGFKFQIDDANGVAGVNSSLLNISGALDFSATAADPFMMEIYSIDHGLSAPGTLANFDVNQSYRWLFLTAAGGITNFDSSLFAVDASQFANKPTSFSFSVTQTGNSLFLEFSPTAVPEPSTWALLALGAGVLVVVGRRRSRR